MEERGLRQSLIRPGNQSGRMFTAKPKSKESGDSFA
jgi:hypothetical protein